MKICLIAPAPPFRGGIAKYCHSLARELEKRHELLLLSYKRQYPALLYGRKNQIDPGADRCLIQQEFRDLSYDIDSANPLSWRRTTERITAFSPDLVILPWWVSYWAPMYLYLLRHLNHRGIRTLILCINVFEHEDNPVKKLLTRLVLSRVPAIIVHSGPELVTLRMLNPTADIRKHPLPLFKYPVSATRREASPLRLLFFGFVRPYKGLDILLKAMAMCDDLDVTLKIAGEFWQDKESYLTLIRELGIASRVEIVDRYLADDDMGKTFDEADLVVLPYRESKTSGVIATAYGFGKPVLATDVGGFHEVVTDGVTGKLVPPGNIRAFSEGIAWFQANREVDFGSNIRRMTEQCMSWRSLVDMIEELSNKTAPGSRVCHPEPGIEEGP